MKKMSLIKSLWLIASTVFALSSSVFAQETPWQDHQGKIKTRIIAAPEVAGDAQRFAWEAVIEPGWKTYWRSPGDAGLPVEIKMPDGANIELDYPMPERFELFGLETYGYADTVVIPFQLDLAGAESVTLGGEFMICKDICIPFNTSYTVSADMPSAAGTPQQIKIDSWSDRVPLRGDKTVDGMAVAGARVVGPRGKQKLIVDVAAESALREVDLLAESMPGLTFGKPEVRLQGDGTKARLVLDVITGKDMIDLRGATVRLTFTANGFAIDRTVAL